MKIICLILISSFFFPTFLALACQGDHSKSEEQLFAEGCHETAQPQFRKKNEISSIDCPVCKLGLCVWKNEDYVQYDLPKTNLKEIKQSNHFQSKVFYFFISIDPDLEYLIEDSKKPLPKDWQAFTSVFII